MEARILVKRHYVGSMGRAKDVSAVAAVMATGEDAKRGAARRRVADLCSRIRLYDNMLVSTQYDQAIRL